MDDSIFNVEANDLLIRIRDGDLRCLFIREKALPAAELVTKRSALLVAELLEFQGGPAPQPLHYGHDQNAP